LRASHEIDIVVGFVEEGPGHRYYNAGAYLSAGEVRHVHRKLFLPTYGMFQEGREFAPGDRLRGFDSPHGPCGLLICEDLWHPTCPWLLAQDGVEILLSLTLFAVHVNRVGCEDGLTFGGGSFVVDPFGAVLAEAPVLKEALVTVDLEADAIRRARTIYPLLRDEDLELVYRELGRIRRERYDLQDLEVRGGSALETAQGGGRDTDE
jgi:predicted amidohydrolase